MMSYEPDYSDELGPQDVGSRAFHALRLSLFQMIALTLLAVLVVVFAMAEIQRVQRFNSELERVEARMPPLLSSYNAEGLQALITGLVVRNGLQGVRVVDNYGSTVASEGQFSDSADMRDQPVMDRNGATLGYIALSGAGYRPDGMLLLTLASLYGLALVMAYLALGRMGGAWVQRHVSDPMRWMVQHWLSPSSEAARDRDYRALSGLPSVTRAAAAARTMAGQNRSLQTQLDTVEAWGDRLNNALAFRLDNVGEAVVFMDGEEMVLRCPPSSRINEDELQTLAKLVTSRKALPALLSEAGYAVLDVQAPENPLEMDRCYVQRDEGPEWELNRFFGPDGQMMLTIQPARALDWFNKMLSRALEQSRSGLSVFDAQGRLRQEVGESGRKLIPNLNGVRGFGLSDLLAQFPKLENFDTKPIQTFDFETDNKEVFRIWMRANTAGWVAIFHQDVSEMLRREKQLIESQRLKELGEIASGIAHDFNNSLGVVLGNLQLAIASGVEMDADHMATLTTAKQAADQASAVVAQLMSYSRKQVLNAKVTNIDRLIKDNQRVLATALTGKHALKLDLKADHLIYIDPGYLSAAIMNLVINARDAMTSNGTVTIATRLVRDRKGKVQSVALTVVDTGSGIPPHIRDKVFAPFFSTKPEGDGSGLGLSMVKGFVEQSNGQIELESSSAGTTFLITLPAIDDLHVPDNAPMAQLISADLAGKRVLLVDDNRLVLGTQAALLRRAGVIAVECDSPYEALDVLREAPPFDALILDMQMPEMHGLDLATKVRQFLPDLPIIACSGNFDPDSVAHARTLRIAKLLEKPARLEDLQRAVQEAIGGQSRGPKLVLSNTP